MPTEVETGLLVGLERDRYLCLAYAKKVVGRIGPMGIDAVTRIVGFLVSAMGMGLVFHGVVEAFQEYGVLATH